MGLFVMDMGNSAEDSVSAALANIEIIKDNPNHNNEYLHSFIENCLKNALIHLSNGNVLKNPPDKTVT